MPFTQYRLPANSKHTAFWTSLLAQCPSNTCSQIHRYAKQQKILYDPLKQRNKRLGPLNNWTCQIPEAKRLLNHGFNKSINSFSDPSNGVLTSCSVSADRCISAAVSWTRPTSHDCVPVPPSVFEPCKQVSDFCESASDMSGKSESVSTAKLSRSLSPSEGRCSLEGRWIRPSTDCSLQSNPRASWPDSSTLTVPHSESPDSEHSLTCSLSMHWSSPLYPLPPKNPWN